MPEDSHAEQAGISGMAVGTDVQFLWLPSKVKTRDLWEESNLTDLASVTANPVSALLNLI